MDPALGVVIGTAVTGLASIAVAGIGAWVSIAKGELAAENRRLRKQVESLGGDPDED